MKHFAIYKKFLIAFSIISFLTIIYVTIDVVNEEESIVYDIDFANKSDVISSYATIVYSILTFLSIIFVIYALLEQKNSTLKKEFEERYAENKKLIESLKLLSNYLKTFISSVNEMDKELKEYILKERKQPTISNILHFTVNKNFSRVIEMDVQSIYKAFQVFNKDPNWEKDFVRLYKLIDFYNDLFIELKDNNKNHKDSKVKELKKISQEILNIYNKKIDLIDNYKKEFPTIYNNKPWVEIANKSVLKYYAYLGECEKYNKQTDFEEVSKILEEFLQNGLKLRESIGLDKYESKKIMRKCSNVRKKIFWIKSDALHYVNDLEKYHEIYFIDANHNIAEFNSLIQRIDTIVLRNEKSVLAI